MARVCHGVGGWGLAIRRWATLVMYGSIQCTGLKAMQVPHTPSVVVQSQGALHSSPCDSPR
jgi:hypothetical protein